MYELLVKGNFSAAHNLRDYKGKCEHLHGHNYNVEVYLEKKNLEKNGIAVDFSEIKLKLNEILEKLDHKYLNKDIDFFKNNNPSAENIAKFIFTNLKKMIKKAKIKKVSVWESEDSCATYFEK
jgi:6-pyruvoyltetrahydropterin/6-carboxytetrahydropterin synthase